MWWSVITRLISLHRIKIKYHLALISRCTVQCVKYMRVVLSEICMRIVVGTGVETIKSWPHAHLGRHPSKSPDNYLCHNKNSWALFVTTAFQVSIQFSSKAFSTFLKEAKYTNQFNLSLLCLIKQCSFIQVDGVVWFVLCVMFWFHFSEVPTSAAEPSPYGTSSDC